MTPICGLCGRVGVPSGLPQRYICAGCCWFRWPRPAPTPAEVGPVPEIRVAHERGIFAPHLDRIERYARKGRFCDVGCGLGGFAGEAFGRGWAVYATEVRPELVAPVRAAFGYDLMLGDFCTLDLPKMDAIGMHHGIEHLPDPVGAIEKARKLLMPGGVLYLVHPAIHEARYAEEADTSVSLGAHNYEWTPYQFQRLLAHWTWEYLWHDRSGDSQYWMLRCL